MKRLILITGVIALVLGTAHVLHAKEITVRGRLQKTVEAGGWLIVSGETKYLLLNARNYQNNDWFKESTNVEAVGETKEVMTIYMEGTPFEAKSVKPIKETNHSGQPSVQTQTDALRQNPGRGTRVMITGNSVVRVQPDTAILTFSVVTQARRAIEAQQQNAAKTESVVQALKAATGAGAEIKTSGYSLQPQRVYKENQPPTISGYEARNTITVTMRELDKIGNVIDAAAQAGSNDISGIQFTLREDQQARNRALSEATREAMNKAQALAQTLGGRVVRIVEVQEEGFQERPPQPLYRAESMLARQDAVSTPIEIGSLEITSRVQVVAEVEPN